MPCPAQVALGVGSGTVGTGVGKGAGVGPVEPDALQPLLAAQDASCSAHALLCLLSTPSLPGADVALANVTHCDPAVEIARSVASVAASGRANCTNMLAPSTAPPTMRTSLLASALGRKRPVVQ